MTIQSAAAALGSTFTFLPKTGFINYQDGQLDSDGSIKALGSSRWGSLTTWTSFNNYITSRETIRWTAPMIDIGSVDYFNLEITAVFEGSVYYIVHVSDTGIFGGEETEYTIEDGDMNLSAFRGRFVYVTAVVNGASISRLTVSTNTNKSTIKIANVDTSTLSGSITNRVLSLPVSVSAIYDINIECQAPTAYAVNLYVSDTPTSQVLIPVVKSKSASAPAIALYGIDNDPRDGIVDITITALPRMIVSGGNILVLA